MAVFVHQERVLFPVVRSILHIAGGPSGRDFHATRLLPKKRPPPKTMKKVHFGLPELREIAANCGKLRD